MKTHPILAPLLAMIAVSAPIVLPCSSANASTTCVADIDRDGQVNVSDLLITITAWGACSPGPCAADIAPAPLDAQVNVNDLLVVLSGWGQCPAAPPAPPPAPALAGAVVWCEDFSLGNYARWSSGYSNRPCTNVNFAYDRFASPGASHRSAINCSQSDVHRGYGGLRFQGDAVLPSYSVPSSGGLDAPHGVVVTFKTWLDVPYVFSTMNSGRWLSLMTVTDDCSHNWSNVLTLGLEDESMRLRPAHVNSIQMAAGAPSFPLRQWVRTTVYINYYSGQMHVWQNGQKVCSATFSRAGTRMCQWHFGLYASGPNNNIVLYEDDLRIVKLLAPLPNVTAEPQAYSLPSLCANG